MPEEPSSLAALVVEATFFERVKMLFYNAKQHLAKRNSALIRGAIQTESSRAYRASQA
jgi:hypothetical protein